MTSTRDRLLSAATGVGPVLLGLATAAVVLLALGRDPTAFYADIVRRALLSGSGLEDMLTRMAPLLLVAAGLIVAFRAGIWNVGGDGQFLMAAAVVAGLGPAVTKALPGALGLVVLGAMGALVGAVWTLVPGMLKAYQGVNEVVTSLMMSFVGINLANLLVKGPFRSTTTDVPQTAVIARADMLPDIPGSDVHVGLLLALVAIGAVHYVTTRTATGLRLDVLGGSPRAALHAGLPVPRLTVFTFMASGAFMGLAGAVEILGVWGYVRADWNPGFGLTMFALVFLARLNALACIPLVAFYATVSIGGHYAARRAELPDDFILVVVGLILLAMALTSYVAVRRAALVGAAGTATGRARGGTIGGGGH